MNTITTASAGGCCDDTHADSAIRLDEAVERILGEIEPVEGSETVALKDALGRILDEDVASRVDVPSHTNSAMDGYALAGTALSSGAPVTLTVVGTSWAGRPLERAHNPQTHDCGRLHFF